MSELIHTIGAVTDARYGVNILEEQPPGAVRGVGTNKVAMIANLPWGPVDEVVHVTNGAEFFEQYCPPEFGHLLSVAKVDAFPALRAIIGKTFPNGLQVLRTKPSGQATATFTAQDSTPADSVVLTARYPGFAGNQVKFEWTVNADNAGHRDLTIEVKDFPATTTLYSKTYTAVVTGTDASDLHDPGDPFVSLAFAPAVADVPDGTLGQLSLAGGSEGTAASGDYLGASGVDIFADPSIDWSVLFVGEPPDGFIDAINAGLKSFADTHKRGVVVLCTPAAQPAATAQTYVATYRGDRHMYPWPQVKVIDSYDPDRGQKTVQGNSFAAVAIASTPPENSPGGASGAPYLKGIVALEQTGTSATTLKALNDAGVAPFVMSRALEGAIIHRGVTTTLVAGKTKVFRRTMTDYIIQSIADRLQQFVELPLDIDLGSQTLGPVTGPEVAEVQTFLQDLKSASRIRDFSLDVFSGNTQTNVDAGQWIWLISVKLVSQQEEIVLRASIGEGVTITQAA